MGLMRNKNLEMEYLTAIEDLGIELDLDMDKDKEDNEEKENKEKNNKKFNKNNWQILDKYYILIYYRDFVGQSKKN